MGKSQEYEGLRRKIKVGESDPHCDKHFFCYFVILYILLFFFFPAAGVDWVL